MSIRLPRQYKRAIPAGESVLLKKAGQYFYCPEADQVAFTVRVDDANEMIVGAGRGWQAAPEEPGFDELRIVNTGGAVLNVTIEIGFGRPLDQRLTLTGVVAVQGVLGGTPVLTARDAETLGANFVGASAISTTVAPLVLPASNVNGLVLRYIDVTLTAAARIAIYADAGIPVGISDVTKRRILGVSSNNSNSLLPLPMLVPAGAGLWAIGSVATSGNVHLGYDLL